MKKGGDWAGLGLEKRMGMKVEARMREFRVRVRLGLKSEEGDGKGIENVIWSLG